jgi:transposase
MAVKLRKDGHSMKEIAAAFGVHVATVYRLGIT